MPGESRQPRGIPASGRIAAAAIAVGCLSVARRVRLPRLWVGLLLFCTPGLVSAQLAGAEAPADSARVTLQGADIFLPPSTYLSTQARRALAALMSASPGPGFDQEIDVIRAFNTRQEQARLAEARRLYSVRITSRTIGGVRVDEVVPDAGIAPENARRALILLHGGGFMWGAGAGARSEAVPIAAMARIRVIAVDYRMAPEHVFPAASEDVAAVYRSLLESYDAAAIGLYGCSAGGILAAQAVAWFDRHGLPRPGAIATACATGAEVAGDSSHLAPLSMGRPIPPGGRPLALADLPYFRDADPADPLAFPIASAETLAGFPPTLLLAGTRDFSASSLTLMHRRLRAAGVAAELFLFDGLWHAFMMDPSLPESREAYEIIARFFALHLAPPRPPSPPAG